jgi:hypothetical protein
MPEGDKLKQLVLSKSLTTPDELHESDFPTGLRAIYNSCNAYLAGKDGIQCFRVGKKIMIPTAPLKRKILGTEAQAAS